jgi:class 3 adenylate cyclase
MVAGFAPVLAQWMRRGGLSTGVGIGVASGEAIIGNIGSTHHMAYTIIGDAVNTAARLMQMAKAGELLVSGPVCEAIRGAVAPLPVVSKGRLALRGKLEPMPVYSVELGSA